MAKLTMNIDGIDMETRKELAVSLRNKANKLRAEAQGYAESAELLDPLFNEENKPAGGAAIPPANGRGGAHRKPASARQVTAGGKTPTEGDIIDALATFDVDNPVALVELSRANGWNNDRANAVVNVLIAAGKIGSNNLQKKARRLFGLQQQHGEDD